MIHYLSKYKSPRLFAGCYCEIRLSESKNFNERTIGQLVGKSGERKEEFFSLTGVKPHIEYSDDKPTLMLSKYNSREVKLANLLGERFKTTKSWSSSSIHKHFRQLQERLTWEERELGEKILEEYWVEKSKSSLAELVGRMSNERYSSTQTLLEHSIEIAEEAKKAATALSLDTLKLQRMALFHDIGKVVLPYYQHTSNKVIEHIPELQTDSEIVETILTHHNPLGSLNSPYIALIAMINRMISQAHFTPLNISKVSLELKEKLEKLLEAKVQTTQISHFHIISFSYYFWCVLRNPKENQEELTQQLTSEFNSLIKNHLKVQNYPNTTEKLEERELKQLNISIFWLPEIESGDKPSFTRLKLLNFAQALDSEIL